MNKTSKPRNVLFYTLPVTLLLLLLIFYLYDIGAKKTREHIAHKDALMEIRIHLSTAHLWLEEILSGDKQESLETVIQSMNHAKWFSQTLISGNTSQAGFYYLFYKAFQVKLTSPIFRMPLNLIKNGAVLSNRCIQPKKFLLRYPTR